MRHTRKLATVLAAVAGLLASGCGGSSGASEETTTTAAEPARVVKAGLRPPAGCFLTVYLGEPASVPQRRQVQSLMLSSDGVETVAYVPKALALKRLAQRKPDVARGMRLNLFPNTFEVVPRTRLDVYSIIAGFAAGVPGVTNVRASVPCGSTS
jgi:hypothetical protein